MKKILFATTALVATAGAASAEVALSGFAEIGIVGGEAYATPSATDGVTQFHSDIDVFFTMTGEADNGLTFGATIDIDETDDGDAFNPTDQGGESYFVAFGPMRLSMGDVDGAFDAALTETNIGGTLADDQTVHAGYNGNAGLDGTYDGQVATFSYAAAGFTGYLSAEVDDSAVGDSVYGLGVKYSTTLAGATVGAGLGYQTTDVNSGTSGGSREVYGISLDATLDSGLRGIINYSEQSRDAWAETQTHVGLGVGYTWNALTVSMNYGKYDNHAGVDGDEDHGYGLVANYDLGGGLEAQFGYGYSDMENGGVDTDSDSFSLGLAMDF